MTNKSKVLTLTLAALAFALSVLPVSPAQAECETVSGKLPLACPPGWKSGKFNRIENEGMLECCRVSTTAPASRMERPVKNIGKGRAGETPAAIVAACTNKGWTWDAQRRQCRPVKDIGRERAPEAPAAIIAACEDRGGVWSEEARRCKNVRKKRRHRDDD